MTCDEIKNMLPGYLDDDLPPEDAEKIVAHLKACDDCVRLLADLNKATDVLKELPDVAPPPFFEQRIMSRIREEAASNKSFFQKLFYPFHIKIPIQAVVTVFIAVLAFYVYRGSDPEIKQIAPLPIPGAVHQQAARPQAEPPVPVEKAGSVKDKPAPAPFMRKKASGLKEGPSYATPPPGKGAVQDQSAVTRAPAREEGSSPSAPESAASTVIEDNRMRLSANQDSGKRQAKAPGQNAEKAVGTAALKAEKKRMEKDMDAENIVPMKQDRLTTAAPSFSRTPSGDAQTAATPDATIQVSDFDGAYQKIEKIVHESNGRIVEIKKKDGSTMLNIEIDALQYSGFLNQLDDIGPVERHRGPPTISTGKAILLIKMIRFP